MIRIIIYTWLSSVFITSQSQTKAEMIQSGVLTKEMIIEAANQLPHNKDDLQWFADNVQLFSYITHDNLKLQGYFFDTKQNPLLDNNTNTNRPILVHCAGYTETTLKYPHYYKYMNNLGFPIFSFDLRGQGFSQYTGPYEDSITHCHSVQETYVEDLLGFLKKYVLPYSNNIIYSASSLSGLVGLALQTQHPGMPPAYAYLYIHALLIIYVLCRYKQALLYYIYFVYTTCLYMHILCYNILY